MNNDAPPEDGEDLVFKDDEDEDDEDDVDISEMNKSEIKVLAKKISTPLMFDKQLLDDNNVHLVARYREIGKILDTKARKRITKKM
eukprot:SAG11_NODE_8797_length_975_cov_0.966895_1_plen_85_part_10